MLEARSVSHCAEVRLPEAALISLNQPLIFRSVKIVMGIVKFQKPHSLISGIFLVKSYERISLEVWLSYWEHEAAPLSILSSFTGFVEIPPFPLADALSCSLQESRRG